jgi:RHS repeat-associated protein
MIKIVQQALLIPLTMIVAVISGTATADVTYFHHDALGSVVAATNESGTLLWRESYQPFGERLDKEVSSDQHAFYYTGKPHDDRTGLSYFGARFYDPVIGRFMGMDSVGVDAKNVHSFNRYAYASNNPYRYVDPDGREVVPVGTRWERAAIYVALAYLRFSNATTRSQLHELESSPNIHTIRFPKPGEVMRNITTGSEANASNGIGTGSETIVNVKKESAVLTKKGNLFIGSGPSWLAHELLGHGLDKDRGRFDDKSTTERTGQLISEENAMQRANTYRKSQREALRTEY